MIDKIMIMDTTPSLIGLCGNGLLAQAVRQHLAQHYILRSLQSKDLTCETAPCSLLIVCDDNCDPRRQQEINRQCLRLGLSWLRVCVDFGQGIIGPWVVPGEPGCVLCVETRMQAAMRDTTDVVQLQDALREIEGHRLPSQPWLTAWSLDVLALFVEQEVATGLEQPLKVWTHHAVILLDLVRLHYQRHAFLPEPECPACGMLPPDSAEAAEIKLTSQLKLRPEVYRVRSLVNHATQLFETYIDKYSGIIHMLSRETNYSIASAICEIGIAYERRPTALLGLGRALNYQQSELSAIAEALERHGGQRPKGKHTIVRASYNQLCKQGLEVLDPTILGLHTPEQYAQPDCAYVSYHQDLIFHWVWGYSFQRGCPILVPEQIAYYGLRRAAPVDKQPFFVYEISNGCALGNCLEEAIFYGMLEVAERDAFLLTWYAQLSALRLDLRSARDPLVNLLIENLEYATGYTISAFDITYDHGVVCCWVMAVDNQDRADMAKVLCTAGSHPDPEQAIINALEEIDSMIKLPPDWFRQQRERAVAMLTNPFAVTTMEDHSCLYFLPEAFERLAFLTRSQPLHTFQEIYGDMERRPVHLDLRDDLTDLIHHYMTNGIDVIVVDQTSSEHAAQNFRCVKVLMPGMLPMTFGQQNRRVSGFPRLYSLPFTLGYCAELLTESQINPHPHPFP
jgi:ribosomal protein S12 methylthiotransferase accessory factor